MDNQQTGQKFAKQRSKMSRNMEIVQEWLHRYREGIKPITLADLAVRYSISKNRVFAIIKRYGKNDNSEGQGAE